MNISHTAGSTVHSTCVTLLLSCTNSTTSVSLVIELFSYRGASPGSSPTVWAGRQTRETAGDTSETLWPRGHHIDSHVPTWNRHGRRLIGGTCWRHGGTWTECGASYCLGLQDSSVLECGCILQRSDLTIGHVKLYDTSSKDPTYNDSLNSVPLGCPWCFSICRSMHSSVYNRLQHWCIFTKLIYIYRLRYTSVWNNMQHCCIFTDFWCFSICRLLCTWVDNNVQHCSIFTDCCILQYTTVCNVAVCFQNWCIFGDFWFFSICRLLYISNMCRS